MSNDFQTTYGDAAGKKPTDDNAKQFLAGVTGKTPEGTDKKTEGQQTSQKKLDNNQNNDYIEGDNSGLDDEMEKFQRLLETNFQGDPLKVVKSYVNIQAKATKDSQRAKELEKQLGYIDQLVDREPKLKDILDRVSKGESLENLFGVKNSTTEQSSTPSNIGQLDTFEDISESELVKAGFLDDSRKAQLSEFEWNRQVLRATQKHMMAQVQTEARKVATQTYEEKTQELNKQRRLQYIQEENQRRYTDGLKRAAMQGYDFTGEHEPLLNEIEDELVTMRDKRDPELFRQDAFDLATRIVAERNGITLHKQQTTTQQNVRNLPFDRNITGSGKQTVKQPTNFMDALAEKSKEIYRNKSGDYMKAFSGRE